IAPGATINGDLWQNPSSIKWSLFPKRPKPPMGATSGCGKRGMKAAQERKAADIEKAQENKNHGIKVAAAMRDATLITIALLEHAQDDGSGFHETFKATKEWYLKEWSATEKSLDIPF